MNRLLILRVFTILLMLFSLFFFFPIIIALIFDERHIISAFLIPAIIVMLIGIPLLILTRNHKNKTNLKQSLLLVPLCWISVAILGSIPYMLSGAISSFSAALFETSSGLTTTGASTLSDIESLPHAILFWRALTHWLGGMGIVVLAVALFPQVGIGGNILLSAESPGPTLEKITPKINEMAKVFWKIYALLTCMQTLLLILGGMHWFDAITHSFATLATGGFSTKNNGIMAYSHSTYLQLIITIFMILAGMNFAVYFALVKKKFKTLFHETELHVYLLIILITTLLITFNLAIFTDIGFFISLRNALFQVSTIITTTGFSSVDFELWPYFSQSILFILMFIGGCAGSTGGGIKVVRITVIAKYIQREIVKFFSPRRIQQLSLNKKPINEDYVKIVIFFVLCYISLLLITTIVVTLDNVDILTAFTTALATLGNIGPGFGLIGPTDNFAFFSPWLKTFLSLVMITGRLELFTVLIIFSPRFWK